MHAKPLEIRVCKNCGMKNKVVPDALDRMQEQHGERLTVQVLNCLYSCNFPAVIVGDRQFLISDDDTAKLEEHVAGCVVMEAN